MSPGLIRRDNRYRQRSVQYSTLEQTLMRIPELWNCRPQSQRVAEVLVSEAHELLLQQFAPVPAVEVSLFCVNQCCQLIFSSLTS